MLISGGNTLIIASIQGYSATNNEAILASITWLQRYKQWGYKLPVSQGFNARINGAIIASVTGPQR